MGVSRHQMEQSLVSHDKGLGFTLHGMEVGGGSSGPYRQARHTRLEFSAVILKRVN